MSTTKGIPMPICGQRSVVSLFHQARTFVDSPTRLLWAWLPFGEEKWEQRRGPLVVQLVAPFVGAEAIPAGFAIRQTAGTTAQGAALAYMAFCTFAG